MFPSYKDCAQEHQPMWHDSSKGLIVVHIPWWSPVPGAIEDLALGGKSTTTILANQHNTQLHSKYLSSTHRYV